MCNCVENVVDKLNKKGLLVLSTCKTRQMLSVMQRCLSPRTLIKWGPMPGVIGTITQHKNIPLTTLCCIVPNKIPNTFMPISCFSYEY